MHLDLRRRLEIDRSLGRAAGLETREPFPIARELVLRALAFASFGARARLLDHAPERSASAQSCAASPDASVPASGVLHPGEWQMPHLAAVHVVSDKMHAPAGQTIGPPLAHFFTREAISACHFARSALLIDAFPHDPHPQTSPSSTIAQSVGAVQLWS